MKLVSYFILFSMVCLSVPREWIHDCEHQDLHAESGTGSDFSQEDCFACDYDLDVMEFSNVFIPVVSFQPVVSVRLSKTQKPQFEECGEKQRRGPPSIG